MRKFMLFLVFVTAGLSAEAQKGCLRTVDGLLYTQQNFLGFYELVGPSYRTSAPYCPRVQLGTKTGVACYFVLGGPAYDEYNYVLVTATGPVQCNLDHYAYGALAIAGLFAVRRLRNLF